MIPWVFLLKNIVLIGDLIINHVNPSCVKDSCAAKIKSVEKTMAYTIQEVAKVVNEQTSFPKKYVIHVGTNDLKNRPVNTAVEDMKHLCNLVLDKNPNNKLIISKVLPKVHAGRKTNNSLTMFNILVEDEFCEHKNVSFSHNNNFGKNGDYPSFIHISPSLCLALFSSYHGALQCLLRMP